MYQRVALGIYVYAYFRWWNLYRTKYVQFYVILIGTS